jgi:hypothetical protein
MHSGGAFSTFSQRQRQNFEHSDYGDAPFICLQCLLQRDGGSVTVASVAALRGGF